jgi:hypothetical protein
VRCFQGRRREVAGLKQRCPQIVPAPYLFWIIEKRNREDAKDAKKRNE